jgi:endonuclease I
MRSVRHGVVIPSGERDMFDQWSADDSVLPWEKQRDARIFDHTLVHNPFVHGVTADPAEACSWE